MNEELETLGEPTDYKEYELEEGQRVRVYSFWHFPEEYFIAYTSGSFFRSSNKKYDLLCLTNSSPYEIDMNEVFISLCDYYICYPNRFTHGAYTNFKTKLDPNMNLKDFVLVHINFEDEDGILYKYYLQVIPISEKEKEFCEIYGSNKLMEYFIDKKINVFDFARKCSFTV